MPEARCTRSNPCGRTECALCCGNSSPNAPLTADKRIGECYEATEENRRRNALAQMAAVDERAVDERDDRLTQTDLRGDRTLGKGGSRNGSRHKRRPHGTWTCPVCKLEFCEHRPADAGRPPLYDEPMGRHPFKPRIFETEVESLKSTHDITALPLREIVRIMRRHFERHGLDAVDELRERLLCRVPEPYRGGGPIPVDLERTVAAFAERWPLELLDWWRTTRKALKINDAVLCREIVTQYTFLALHDADVWREMIDALDSASNRRRSIA